MIQENHESEENLDLPTVAEGQEDTTDWRAEAQKLREKAIRQRESTKALKAKLTEFEKARPQDKVENTKTDNFGLVEKTYLRSAGITDSEEIELAFSTAKKWGVGIDQVVDDEDFKVKLDRHRTNKSNLAATSGIKSGQGDSQAKNTPEYWIAKGVPPTADQVSDRKTRAKIARAMMGNAKNGKKFYNE